MTRCYKDLAYSAGGIEFLLSAFNTVVGSILLEELFALKWGVTSGTSEAFVMPFLAKCQNNLSGDIFKALGALFSHFNLL